MKKYTAYKTVQLVLFIMVAVIAIAWIFPNYDVYHEVAVNPTLKMLAGSLWAVLLLSFVFILLDYFFFFNHLKEYKEMDLAVHSDPVSGIANRFQTMLAASCSTLPTYSRSTTCTDIFRETWQSETFQIY